jgi:hypothetical protein
MALREEFFHTVSFPYTVKCNFSFSCAPLLWVLHSGKMAFPKCHALLGTRESLPSLSVTLREDWLPRVPDFWHSGKHVTLREFSFSRSVNWALYILHRQWVSFVISNSTLSNSMMCGPHATRPQPYFLLHVPSSGTCSSRLAAAPPPRQAAPPPHQSAAPPPCEGGGVGGDS